MSEKTCTETGSIDTLYQDVAHDHFYSISLNWMIKINSFPRERGAKENSNLILRNQIGRGTCLIMMMIILTISKESNLIYSDREHRLG